ncbi:MAG: hypothetical protein M1839_007815 [Geoglossum umbratile]|nr:MAG: hypothetical protein M1839_007815 [Geoglossum umbratile]
MDGVSPEFILTRFAWAIFPLVKAFMEHCPERVVKVWEQCEGGFHEIVKILDLAGFKQNTAASRGRSICLKKRKAADTLPPVVEVKRFCMSSHFKPDEMPTSTDYRSDEERTPDPDSDGEKLGATSSHSGLT